MGTENNGSIEILPKTYWVSPWGYFPLFQVLIYVHLIYISLTAMFRPNFKDNNGRTMDGQWWVNSNFFLSLTLLFSKIKLFQKLS